MNFKKIIVFAIVTEITIGVWAATPQVKNVRAFQQYPWGQVCISYEVLGDVAVSAGSGGKTILSIVAKDKTTGYIYGGSHSGDYFLSGDTGTASGLHKVIWSMAPQGITINSDNVVFKVEYVTLPQYHQQQYCVIDLSSGPKSIFYPVIYTDSPPSGGFNTDEYKTTKLVLRRIEHGTFMMGSGRDVDSWLRHRVTLTKSFYVSVFEVTERQWELVMGRDSQPYVFYPEYRMGDRYPVRFIQVGYVRAGSWPRSSDLIDPNAVTFCGKLLARTGIGGFDLPTEAQWEYACQAGSTHNYSYGEDENGDYMWYSANSGGALHPVGTKLPNAWGLYDVHGNVEERCLDWYDKNAGCPEDCEDPKGADLSVSSFRVVRGGSYKDIAWECYSSYRNALAGTAKTVGFRLVLNLTD